MMKKWEKALNKFLEGWKNKKAVVGAIVCGIYVAGSPSKHSDVDVHIVLDSSISWRERGDKMVDGFLIEYFADPLQKYYEYLQDDYKRRRRVKAVG